MAVSSFATQSASSLSDEGGVVVKAAQKVSESSYLALDSALVAGTYLLKVSGSGTLFINSYSSTTLGQKLALINASTTKSTMITIPAGITGLYFSGSFIGSIIFQTVSSSPKASIVSRSFSEKSRKSEYTGNPKNYRFIPGTNTAIKSTYMNSPYIELVDMTTNTVLASPSSAIFDYRDVSYWSNIARNGNNLVFTAGYAQSSTIRVYRSSDLGYTWSYSEPTVYAAAYAPNVVFAGTRFFIFMSGDGYGNSYSAGHISSADNGATWTANTQLFGYSYGGLAYLNGTYVLFNTQLYYGSYTSYNTYKTSTDGITWTERTSPNNPYGNYGSGTTSHYPKAVFAANNKFYLFVHDYNNQAPAAFTSTDGIAWTVIGNGSYISMMDIASVRNAYGTSIGASGSSHWVTDTGVWYVNYNGMASGYVSFLKFSDNSVTSYYTTNVGPLSGTSEYIRGILGWNNKIAAYSYTQTASVNALFYLDGITNTSTSWNNVITKISGMPSATPVSRIFMSKKFNRYYYFSSDNYLYYSAVGSASGWTKSSITSAQYNSTTDVIAETENFLLVYSSSGPYVYRSADGVTFETIVPPNGIIGYASDSPVFAVKGTTVVTRAGNAAGEFVAVSTDEGKNWNVVPVNQSGATPVSSGYMTVSATSAGFIACIDGSGYSSFSVDGLNWVKAYTPFGVTKAMSVANDVSFWTQQASSPWKYAKTSASSLLPTLVVTQPINSYYIVINQIGTSFIALTTGVTTSTYYASVDGVTWTGYSLPASGAWYPMSGSSTGESTLLWDHTNKMFLELQETTTISLS